MDCPEYTAVYLNKVHDQRLRVLSLINREPFSRTYGCFDRVYWNWKFTDFPGARFQEGVYSLAYLFSNSSPGNNLAGDERLIEWARAGMYYWKKIQYPDGSFDEAYPYEHSLAATAFTTFYLGEAFLLLKKYITGPEQNALAQTFARAANWLCHNDERHGLLTNHLAAAAAALHLSYLICSDERYQKRSNYFLQRIYDHQSKEGWYEEYGGADPGYQTHATFYLARLWQYTGSALLLDSLRRSISFLKHFFHPNRTLGGEYGSRNTEFYFPAGFEMLAAVLPEAALIANFMRPAVIQQSVVGLGAMDSYNLFPMLNNYLFAASHAQPLASAKDELPCQQEGETCFPEAGLFVKSTSNYYAVLGLSKGGGLRVYDRQRAKLISNSLDYWARVNRGKTVISNQSLNRGRNWFRDGNEFTIQVNFAKVNQQTHQPWLFIGFRLFSLTLGRLPAAAYWLKNLLVQVLVSRRRETPLQLNRKIRFESDGIIVLDQLKLNHKLQLDSLQLGQKFSTIHMGSSRYFQSQEVDPPPLKNQDLAAKLSQHGLLQLNYTLPLSILPDESKP